MQAMTGSGARQHLSATVARLKKDPKATIVYCSTTNAVDSVHAMLQGELACKVGKYHGKMGDHQRKDAHTGFLTGQITVIVATIAFGMCSTYHTYGLPSLSFK